MACIPSFNCLNDFGYEAGESIRSSAVQTAATIRQAAAIAIALDNANRLVENYQDQRDISQRAMAIAESQQNQLRTVFWPREEQFLLEFANPDAVETVEVMGRRYGGRLAAMVAGGFAQQLKQAKCSFSRYCTSANKKLIQDLLMARANGIANARVLGRSIAFAEYQARNDKNIDQRLQAVAIGRGLLQQAATLYAKAGQGLASVGGILSGQLSSALEAFGYARRDYSNATGYNSTLARGQQQYANQTYMPSSTGATAQWDGSLMPSQQWNGSLMPNYGLNSSTTSFTDLDASNTFGSYQVDSSWSLSEHNKPNVWNHGQAERQMNEADVGNRSLARFGVRVFPVLSVGAGIVEIDMSQFQLMATDAYNEGDNGPYVL